MPMCECDSLHRDTLSVSLYHGSVTSSASEPQTCSQRLLKYISVKSESATCDTPRQYNSCPFCPMSGTGSCLSDPSESSGSFGSVSTRTSPTSTTLVHRQVTSIAQLVWARTTTMTWLLLLASQPYTRAIVTGSGSHASMNQFDVVFSPDQTQCIHSLLLDPYRIPSAAFTATSDLGESSGTRRYAAENLRSEKTERAWCPNGRVGTELNEFVQVDMGELNAITKMVISGLHAEEGGSRFTPYFYIRYKREANEPEWRTYRQLEAGRTSRLVGSTTALVPKFVVLDPPLIARWFRIYPYRDTPGYVCVRLEAYGCRFADDLVEYQIPEGSLAVPPYNAAIPTHPLSTLPGSQSRPMDLDHNRTVYYEAGSTAAFSDACYDGHRVEPGGLLDGGLGCLTDLSIAPQQTIPKPLRSSAITHNLANDAIVNNPNRWFVGWHRDRWRATKSMTRPDDVVDMRFRFASVRDFKRLRLYASNNYPEKIRLPRRIEVRFSVRGSMFSGQPMIVKDFALVNHSTGVGTIELDLQGRIGQFLQLKAFFADDWLLLSEIKFYSHIATEPILIDEPVKSDRDKTESLTIPDVARQTESTAIPVSSFDLSSAHHLPTVIILALLIAASLVVIGCVFIWIYWKRKHVRAVKHRRAAPLSADMQLDPNDGLSNGRIGGIFPATTQRLNANGTLPKKCSLKNASEFRHLPDFNQIATGRTISNPNSRMSGTTGPSDELSEPDQCHTSDLQPATTLPNRESPGRLGFFASLKKALGRTQKPDPMSLNSPAHCPMVGFGSMQPVCTNGNGLVHPSVQNTLINGLFEQSAIHAYPNNVHMFHGTVQNSPGGLQFPDQALQTSSPMVPLLSMELSNPMLRNGPVVSSSALMHISTTPSTGSDPHSKAWRLQPVDGAISSTVRNSVGASSFVLGSVQPEVGLYTSVSGESDGDSNCASTMSPEYATAGNVSDQLGFGNTLSQLQRRQQQQTTTPAFLTCPSNDKRGYVSYVPSRQAGLISPSLTFTALNNALPTTLTTCDLTQPNSLIFSNPNGGASQMISTGPIDFSLTQSTHFYQPYSSNNPAVIGSGVTANYLTEGAGQFAPFDTPSMSIVNPVLLGRMYGSPIQPGSVQIQQQSQQPTPRVKRPMGNSENHEFSGNRSADPVSEHGRKRHRTGTDDDVDPWIRAPPFGKSNRLDRMNGDHYLSSLRPPVPPTSPPPPIPLPAVTSHSQKSTPT